MHVHVSFPGSIIIYTSFINYDIVLLKDIMTIGASTCMYSCTICYLYIYLLSKSSTYMYVCMYSSLLLLACRSQRIQTPSSYSPGHILQSGVESESLQKVVASDGNARSGFSVGGPLDSGSLRIGASPLAKEKQQSQEYTESLTIGRRDSPLLNGFDKEPKLEGTSSRKENLSENRRQPELSKDDLSPWKKPKPTSLPGVAPASKPSLNPFDGLVYR